MFTTFYSQLGSYYKSPSQGGTVAPQARDLYFTGSYSAPSHVGIIVAVDSNYIYTIDGNWSDRVSRRTIPRNSTEFVAFARPNYTTNHALLTFGYSAQGH